MARVSFIDQDREDQKAEEKAERRRMFNEPVPLDPEPDARFGDLDPDDPEFADADTLAEFLLDDDRETYTCHELQCVWYRMGIRLAEVKAKLASWGLSLEPRQRERSFRGFSDNPHNRWAGNPMAGGGGGGSIYGMVD
jgi:hypothetical protein